MTLYRPAFSWGEGSSKNIEKFLREVIEEKPLLNVCCGRSLLGNVRMDLESSSIFAPPDLIGDMESLPFDDDSFAAVFCDPPWDAPYKEKTGKFMREALRVAPVVYTMSPWTYCSSKCRIEKAWIREHPGVNAPVFLVKYRRVE